MTRIVWRTAGALAKLLGPEAELVAQGILRQDFAYAVSEATGLVGPVRLAALSCARLAQTQWDRLDATERALDRTSALVQDYLESTGVETPDAATRIERAVAGWHRAEAAEGIEALAAAFGGLAVALEARAAIAAGYTPIAASAVEGDLQTLMLEDAYDALYAVEVARRQARFDACTHPAHTTDTTQCPGCGRKIVVLGTDAALRERCSVRVLREAAGPCWGFPGAPPTKSELAVRGWRSSKETYPRALAGSAVNVRRWDHLIASCAHDMRALDAALAAARSQGVTPTTPKRDVDVRPRSIGPEGRRWTF